MNKFIISFLLAAMALIAQPIWAAKAINFELTDSKGKMHRLADYRGKWVLVNFWAPWCPRCWMEFPLLNDFDARQDVVVLGVAMDYGMDSNSVHSYAKRYNLRYPNILAGNRKDPESPAHQVGPVDFYPTSYLYAPDGELVMFIPGIVSKNKLTAFMDSYVPAGPTMVAQKEPELPPAVSPLATPAPVATTTAKPSAVKPATILKPAAKSGKKKIVSQY